MKRNNTLSTIIASKRLEVESEKRSIPMERLRDKLTDVSFKHSMRRSLAASSSGIIAEFKRRSPSMGWINRGARAEEIVPAYEKAGAAALSILTDEPFFGGSLTDLHAIRPLVNIPVLRKEFIIDPYQLYQAKIAGADAVLLIASALEREQCASLTALSHQIGLEVLLEVHNEAELEYITPHTDMVGVNNRRLTTFHTDVNHSLRMATSLPQHVLWVSESGIADAATARQLRDKGFRGLLIGEAFMKTAHPQKALHSFITQLHAQ